MSNPVQIFTEADFVGFSVRGTMVSQGVTRLEAVTTFTDDIAAVHYDLFYKGAVKRTTRSLKRAIKLFNFLVEHASVGVQHMDIDDLLAAFERE